MDVKPGEMVFPGDVIKNLKSIKGVTLLGPGLQRSDDPNTVSVTRAGTLCQKRTNVYWTEKARKRYVPKTGDLVVGVVAKKAGETLKVDIGSAELASLSVFAFEDATKQQKPDLQVGDAVYAKLLSAHSEMEPELICVDKDFEAGNLGPLSSDGFLFSLSPPFVHRVLSIEPPILQTLRRKFAFETAFGMNGKVWINTHNTEDALTLMNALLGAQYHLLLCVRHVNKVRNV